MARKPRGKLLGIPYNSSPPKRGQVGRGLWDPDEPRLFPPKKFGWGYGINFAALFRRRRG